MSTARISRVTCSAVGCARTKGLHSLCWTHWLAAPLALRRDVWWYHNRDEKYGNGEPSTAYTTALAKVVAAVNESALRDAKQEPAQ